MGRFTGKIMTFLYGRYGIDALGKGLFGLYFALWFVNLFVGSSIVWIISILAVLCFIFRALSKNIVKRRAENEIFLKLWNPLKSEIRLLYDRLHDIKTNRYRKCNHCKAVIKLPRKRGRHTVRCPKCGERFSVTIII